MIYKTIPITERADGSLQIDSRNINLRQGDYNFKLQYSTYKDYSNYSPVVNVQVAFRRKDGQQTGWLPMSHIREKEYSINLKNSWFTKEAGILYMTFRVFQTNENNVQLIINTASASLPIIPIAQFNPEEEDLLPSEFEVYMSQTNEAIEDLRNDLALNQLGKGIFDNEQELLTTYPNGKDYPEGTWAVLLSTNTVWLYNGTTKVWYNSGRDVTDIFDLDDNVYRFAKQLYEESKNEFDISRLSLAKGTINIYNSTITFTSYSNDSVNKLKDFTDLEVGKTYILNFSKTNAISNDYIYLAGSTTQWLNGTAHTITQAELDGVVVFYGRTEYENIISEIMISENGGEYQPYNSASHITNEQADLLKSEWEKQINLYDGEVRNGAYLFSGGVYDGNLYQYLCPTDLIPIEPNTLIFIDYVDEFAKERENADHGFLFYDINKNYVGYYQTLNVCKVPSNAYYFVFNICHTKTVNKSVLSNLRVSSYGKILNQKDITPILLWENGNPNVAFEGQDINLNDNVTNYKEIKLCYKKYANIGEGLSETLILNNNVSSFSEILNWCYGNAPTTSSRLCTFSGQTVSFGSAYYNSEKNSEYCIPVAIYGIKGV